MLKLNNNAHTDQTGKFRVRSIRGNNYMFITCFYDSNAILVRPMKPRKGFELVETTKDTCECLGVQEHKPNHQTIYNENSSALKENLKPAKVTFQLAPHH